MERTTLSALVVLLVIFGAVIASGHLLNLQKMIKQVTDKNPFRDFFMYGCYCGMGGEGAPLDATDWCCFYHDCCYEEMMKRGCKPITEGYSHTYLSGNVSCGGGTQCQQKICECDRNFVLCLKKHLGSYKKSRRFYFNAWCRSPKPECSPTPGTVPGTTPGTAPVVKTA